VIGRLPFDSSIGSGGQSASALRSQSKTLESACANACIVGLSVVDLRKVMSTKLMYRYIITNLPRKVVKRISKRLSKFPIVKNRDIILR